ncbi:DUF2278 family protein [Spiroplasma endosymbiont of Stenodema calcarata]|uniref:DUF2278 family protein n=1 Tax=Spiroplasma endosymbiont of Stenodema calcarata TaxID=3139328 RepID=UPI003CCA8CBC
MDLTKIHWWSRTPHFMFNLQINEQNYEVVVNVYSKIAPRNLKYFLTNNITHPILERAIKLKDGVYRTLPLGPDGLAIDYLRSGIIDINQMKVLPPGEGDETKFLNNTFTKEIGLAIENLDLKVCIWGMLFDKPELGLHDVHMNQGNANKKYAKENGVWQDGALIIMDEKNKRLFLLLFLLFNHNVQKLMMKEIVYNNFFYYIIIIYGIL